MTWEALRRASIGIAAIVLLVTAVASAKQIHLLTMSYSTDLMNVLRDSIFPEFEQRYGVEVLHEQVGWNERLDKMNILFAAGQSPDLVLTGFYSPYEEGSNGVLEPLDRYIQDWEYKDTIPDPVWASQSWRGKVYVVPQYFDFRAIAYNKELFGQAGLDVNQPPQSWHDFLTYTRLMTRMEADGDQVTQRGFAGFGIGGNTAQHLMWWVMQGGLDPINLDTMTSNLNREEATVALENMLDLHQAAHLELPGAGGGIFGGNVGMAIQSAHNFQAVANSFDGLTTIDDVGVFAPRRSLAHNPAAINFIAGLAIPAASENKDLAWALIEHLMSRDSQLKIGKVAGWMSPRVDLAEEIQEFSPVLKGYYDIIQYSRAPVIPPPRDIGQQEVNRYVDQTLRAEMSPQEALQRSHELWTRLLSEWAAGITQ